MYNFCNCLWSGLGCSVDTEPVLCVLGRQTGSILWNLILGIFLDPLWEGFWYTFGLLNSGASFLWQISCMTEMELTARVLLVHQALVQVHREAGHSTWVIIGSSSRPIL